MMYPDMNQIAAADEGTLLVWYRSLPGPFDKGQCSILHTIFLRIHELKGSEFALGIFEERINHANND